MKYSYFIFIIESRMIEGLGTVRRLGTGRRDSSFGKIKNAKGVFRSLYKECTFVHQEILEGFPWVNYLGPTARAAWSGRI